MTEYKIPIELQEKLGEIAHLRDLIESKIDGLCSVRKLVKLKKAESRLYARMWRQVYLLYPHLKDDKLTAHFEKGCWMIVKTEELEEKKRNKLMTEEGDG